MNRTEHEQPHDRLRAAREKAGYASAEEFAATHKLTSPTYRSHENGLRGIPNEAAKKYAELLGIEAGWILFGEGEEIMPDLKIKRKPKKKSASPIFKYDPIYDPELNIRAVGRVNSYIKTKNLKAPYNTVSVVIWWVYKVILEDGQEPSDTVMGVFFNDVLGKDDD